VVDILPDAARETTVKNEASKRGVPLDSRLADHGLPHTPPVDTLARMNTVDSTMKPVADTERLEQIHVFVNPN
jgi:hypothetical protein